MIHKLQITLTCPVCGESFTVLPSVARKGRKFCGRSCTYKAQSTRSLLRAVGRFWAKVNKNGPIPEYALELGPCWIWTSTLEHYGYGRFKVGESAFRAHRVSYAMVKGDLPEDLPLDHLCRVTSCVNPDHLEPVTPRENWLRGMSESRIRSMANHCKNGHPWTDANTYRPANRPGARFCRACNRIAQIDSKARRLERAL